MSKKRFMLLVLIVALVLFVFTFVQRRNFVEMVAHLDLPERSTTTFPPAPPHDNARHAATPAHPRPRTVDDRLRQYGEVVRDCFRADFHQRGVAYPPTRLVLVGIKDARRIEVYAANGNDHMQFIRAYPILAASGTLGPKLREGDRQVPEGKYSVAWLNPNSSYHLALRVNYPNAFDRRMACQDGRTQLGGDIMIHGSNASAGCLAMGDAVAEDLFILAAATGESRVTMLLTPVDFRTRELPSDMPGTPEWTAELYQFLKEELKELPLPPD